MTCAEKLRQLGGNHGEICEPRVNSPHAPPPQVADPVAPLPGHRPRAGVRGVVRVGHRDDLRGRHAAAQPRAAPREPGPAGHVGRPADRGRSGPARADHRRAAHHDADGSRSARLQVWRAHRVRRHRRDAAADRRPDGAHAGRALHRRSGIRHRVHARGAAAGSVDADVEPRAAAAQVPRPRRGRDRTVRVAAHRRGGAGDHQPRPAAGLDGRHPALALLRAAALEPAALVFGRRLPVGARRRNGGAGSGRRRHAVQADQAIPRHGFDSLRRLDEVALRDRRRVRRVHADVGVQRPAVDGTVRVDQRDGPRVRARGDDGRPAGADALLEGEADARGRR